MNLFVSRRLPAVALLAAVLSAAGTSNAVAAPIPAPAPWAGTWSAANTESGCWPRGFGNPPQCAPTSALAFHNQSIRMTVRTSIGGTNVRLRFSNVFGKKPLEIGHATVALADVPTSPQLRAGTLRELPFGGRLSVTVPPGSEVVSDPVALDVPARSNLSVSYFLPTDTGPAPVHLTARQPVYVYPGDTTTLVDGSIGFTIQRSSFLLSGIDVSHGQVNRSGVGRSRPSRSVVVIGDSVSDGNGSTMGAYRRWPDLLADRLLTTASTADDWGVLNQSLAGNRLTHDGTEAPLGFEVLGLSGLARLSRDVLAQPGARTVVVQLGVNDILFNADPAERVEAAITQFAAQAADRGLHVIVGTLPPADGFADPAWSADKEAARQAVNAYIRTPGRFDAVFDVDAVLRDPARPSVLRAEFDSGDHLNPNDAGAQALADAFCIHDL
ncbi:SGNH/GDSL hydrolase family protein [Actinoplanes auranticolor]|uniref:SGNH hydrolase n=1 Tax=Actinoplanes auranticolor TaxID=47988 RepID=A0A919VX76_9ACTN|nr:SGNH/GDSL hydrolase family protein [Actinoplanes auranticolor]GIM79092.1 SGNH hydrolase [Actinoplanes auranticolor]